MADYPLLFLPRPTAPEARRSKTGFSSRVNKPARTRQADRLNPQFETLAKTLESRRVNLAGGSSGILPEDVLVLEIVGSVEQFVNAVQKIEGLEWLFELEEEAIPADADFFALDEEGNRKDTELSGRLFLIFTNQEALRQLRSLWDRWCQGQSLPHGFGRWGEVFARLKDLRLWGVQDRLYETGVLLDWEQRIAHGQDVAPTEIELWYRKDSSLRQAGEGRVRELVEHCGGDVLSGIDLGEISYHALLATLPIGALKKLPRLDDVELVRCQDVQVFRAVGQASVPMPAEQAPEILTGPAPDLPVSPQPAVALLDGLPLAGHERLRGRITIDDPDDWAPRYPADSRHHGTAMASLILNGDLQIAERPLPELLYVRPVMRPVQSWDGQMREQVPEDRLFVDLLYRALKRMYDGEAGLPATAPQVTAINFAIGDPSRCFEAGAISPLARLLDWSAWQYRVLWLVSAGNCPQDIELSLPRQLPQVSAAELRDAALRAIAEGARLRRLLSPAESINGLTVGALHQDHCDLTGTGHSVFDLYPEETLPSPINSQGLGYGRSIKPDVLLPGGRQLYWAIPGSGTASARFRAVESIRPPGQKVASPGAARGALNSACFTRGTSNATALATRAALEIRESLLTLRALRQSNAEVLDACPMALWQKVLLVHSADWSGLDARLKLLETICDKRKFREYITRLIGYGQANGGRVLSCTADRATALGAGSLLPEEAHVFHLPIPSSLSGQRVKRRLTVTLAWFTPIRAARVKYRVADLWYTLEKSLNMLGLKRIQADEKAAKRGTVHHELFEGDQAKVIGPDDVLEIAVNHRVWADASPDPIPYALAVTLEVAPGTAVRLYHEIREKLAQRVAVRPRVRLK